MSRILFGRYGGMRKIGGRAWFVVLKYMIEVYGRNYGWRYWKAPEDWFSKSIAVITSVRDAEAVRRSQRSRAGLPEES